MNDEFAASAHEGGQESSPFRPSKPPKKPRDTRLRDCFEITPVDGGYDKIKCRYCSEYSKVLQKFNPTKARKHLTASCTGTDEALIRTLLSSTQAARKSLQGGDATTTTGGGAGGDSDGAAGSALAPSEAPVAAVSAASTKKRKLKDRSRTSPVCLSFHTDVDAAGLDVTAPIENGVLIYRLSFPENELRLSFVAESNTDGAACCIDGFMNTRPGESWMASLCSTTSDGARAGPHCRWSLNPGALEGATTRAHKVEQLLRTMVVK